MPTRPDPLALLRSRGYVVLLVLAAALGVPIAAACWAFLGLISHLQAWVFKDLPTALGFNGTPAWWALLPLGVAGLGVGATIRYLPGRGGHSPAGGLHAGDPPAASWLPGIVIAALISLGLGAVVGPEAPLIALGAGLAVLALDLSKRDLGKQTVMVLGAVGSFAAVSTLLGSPLLGAFLMLEVVGIGGGMASIVLLPGLLAAGIGFLIFLGLGSLTGLGTYSLALPSVPPVGAPTVGDLLWAIGIGLAAAVLGVGIQRLAKILRPIVERRILLLSVAVGLAVAGLAILFTEATGKPLSDVLFSGQSALPTLVAQAGTYTVGTLVLLLACKSLAYGVSLSTFRGGPIFPAMFIGAAGGIALSHFPGLPMITGVAVGIGAMATVMLRLPLVSLLLATVLLGPDGLEVMPVVIVAVVVAFVASGWLLPPQAPPPAAKPGAVPAHEPVTH